MTAVIYARYSSDNQREESIEGQIRECTAYAEKNDITIVKHYIDRAISAKTDNRPQFQQMIKDSDKKLFDIVLVWKLDRFARNRYDSARYKTQLKKNGVKLMSATEIISEGPEGIILESVLEGYAEYYSADLAEKVVRGQTENILKGRCNGGRGTFGYTLDSERKFHIDPLASPFVLESFTKYRDGLTMKEIRDWLNENGIKNPVGGEFTYNSVEHMLKNRRYIGELKFRDVVVPDAIPPIVPLELFDDVQEKIAKTRKDDYDKENYYCYIGRLSPEKGIGTLIEAAKRLPYPLKIIGGGSLEETLRAAAAGSDIELLGYKHWPEIKEIVGKARFCVVPSEWYENNPLSVIESQCLGTPVLGSRIGGIPELIDEGKTGMLFESGNAKELKARIGQMFATPFEYRQIALGAQKRYSAERYYAKLLKIYTSL